MLGFGAIFNFILKVKEHAQAAKATGAFGSLGVAILVSAGMYSDKGDASVRKEVIREIKGIGDELHAYQKFADSERQALKEAMAASDRRMESFASRVLDNQGTQNDNMFQLQQTVMTKQEHELKKLRFNKLPAKGQ